MSWTMLKVWKGSTHWAITVAHEEWCGRVEMNQVTASSHYRLSGLRQIQSTQKKVNTYQLNVHQLRLRCFYSATQVHLARARTTMKIWLLWSSLLVRVVFYLPSVSVYSAHWLPQLLTCPRTNKNLRRLCQALDSLSMTIAV